jgi:hypothetical protein
VTPHIELIKYRYPLLESLYHGIVEVLHQVLFSLRTFGAILITTFSDTATQAEKTEAKNGI